MKGNTIDEKKIVQIGNGNNVSCEHNNAQDVKAELLKLLSNATAINDFLLSHDLNIRSPQLNQEAESPKIQQRQSAVTIIETSSVNNVNCQGISTLFKHFYFCSMYKTS